jgi:hypothetical protein
MSQTPYREQGSQVFLEFEQHMGLAIELLEQFEQMPKRVVGASIQELHDLEREACQAWENLWDQLRQARAIATSLGRDTRAYDTARAAAGDIWLNAADVKVGAWQYSGHGETRTITWHTASTAPAKSAIRVLRAAVPEVVVHRSPPLDLELRSGYKFVANYGSLVVIAVVLGFLVWHFVG